ncbi:MAG TPA: M20/M25/M40 family metallo-hydrolase [Steroidobacteraceae bacterium]|nr:M20/M25/M40 family metallo-hydrolase [Steroidobacteraceae bacterium]
MNNKDIGDLHADISAQWQRSILPCLEAYVRIPNRSPLFDPDWERAGHMERAVQLIAEWCRAQAVPGASVEVLRSPGLTPLLVVDVAGELPGCVLLYGHLDKQPEFSGWLPGLAPWEPVIREGRLYGRGAADDGYAAFSSLAAIAALRSRGVALPRCVLLIEASEESGSIHLPAHLRALEGRLPEPSLVVCLDAECGNYEQLWCTSSLRGNLTGRLTVRVLSEGVHSGLATGIAPTPFRILSELLARLENPVTGELLLRELQVAIPRERFAQAQAAARVLGTQIAGKIPFAEGVRPLSDDPLEQLLQNTWRASLAVTGAEGLPALAAAGNVLLPAITLKISLRLPPGCDPQRASAAVRESLERDPPYAAQVRAELDPPASGWSAPPFAPWLEESLQRASQALFGREAVQMGGGGTIPFLSMLAERFPHTQFMVSGVLGPHSNAHGPNEFLHLEYATRLTTCVALVLADFAATRSR